MNRVVFGGSDRDVSRFLTYTADAKFLAQNRDSTVVWCSNDRTNLRSVLFILSDVQFFWCAYGTAISCLILLDTRNDLKLFNMFFPLLSERNYLFYLI